MFVRGVVTRETADLAKTRHRVYHAAACGTDSLVAVCGIDPRVRSYRARGRAAAAGGYEFETFEAVIVRGY